MKRRDFDHLSSFPLSYMCKHRNCKDGVSEDTMQIVFDFYDKSLERIVQGDNAFDVWASFCGLKRDKRAALLDQHPEMYERFAKQADYTSLVGEDVMRFCLETQIHPADLIHGDMECIPSPIMEALLIVANHSESLYEDKQRACLHIEMELLRFTELPFESVRAFNITDAVYDGWMQYLNIATNEARRLNHDDDNYALPEFFLSELEDHWNRDFAAGRLGFARPYFQEAVVESAEALRQAREEIDQIQGVLPMVFTAIAQGDVTETGVNPTNLLFKLNVRRAYLENQQEEVSYLGEVSSCALALSDVAGCRVKDKAIVLYDNYLKFYGYESHMDDPDMYDVFYSQDDPEIAELLEHDDMRIRDLDGEPETLEEHDVTQIPGYMDYKL